MINCRRRRLSDLSRSMKFDSPQNWALWPGLLKLATVVPLRLHQRAGEMRQHDKRGRKIERVLTRARLALGYAHGAKVARRDPLSRALHAGSKYARQGCSVDQAEAFGKFKSAERRTPTLTPVTLTKRIRVSGLRRARLFCEAWSILGRGFRVGL